MDEETIVYLLGIGIFLYYYIELFQKILGMSIVNFAIYSLIFSAVMYASMSMVSWLSIGNVIPKKRFILPALISGMFLAIGYKAFQLKFLG